MGYTHGTKWSNAQIKDELLNVMNALNINRMPSTSEIRMVTKSSGLQNAIRRHGGYKYWCEELGINIKNSESKTGWDGEMYAINVLLDMGFKVEKMPVKHPYDLLVNDAVKIDVKTGSRFHYSKTNYYFSFNLEKKNATCDLYVILCKGEGKELEKTLIIPSKVLRQTQLCIGVRSKFDEYKDRWDYIQQFSDFYKSI